MDSIEVYINDQLIQLEPQEAIALTYKIAKIGEVGFIQANVSSEITAPYTLQNKAAFDNAEQINNQSELPYDLNTLRIKQNGVWIVNKGSLILEEFNKNYKFSVISGNIDLFAALDGLTIKDLNFSNEYHERDLLGVAQANSKTTGYTYPLVDYGAVPELEGVDEIDTRYQFPCLHISAIMTQIDATLVTAGINFVYDELEAIDLFDKLLLTTATDDEELEYSQRFKNANEVSVEIGAGVFVGTSSEVKLIDWDYISGAAARFSLTNDTYENIITADITVTYNQTSTGLPASSVYLVVYDESSSPKVELDRVLIATQTTDYTLTIPVTVDEALIGFWIDNTSVTDSFTVTSPTALSITISQQNSLEYGKTFDFNAALTEIDCTDFLKAIAQIFGMVFQTNDSTNTVTMKRFDNIDANRANAVDWSGKVDFIEAPVIKYRLDEYGQVNYFRYLEDDNVNEERGRGEVLIDDNVLDPFAEVIELPFAASNQVNYFSFNQPVAVVNVFEPQPTSPIEYERNIGVEPRLIYRESTSDSIDFSDNTGSTTVLNTIYGRFSPSLTWEDLLTNYWVTIKGILESKVKKVELYLRLTEIDIQGLDFFKPVYLNVSDPITGLSINGYFYLEEVKEYQVGKSTEVVLVKLA